jgi:integrase
LRELVLGQPVRFLLWLRRRLELEERVREAAAATELLDEPAHQPEAAVVAEYLGHADLSTVSRYAHVDRAKLFIAAGRLERLADPQRSRRSGTT